MRTILDLTDIPIAWENVYKLMKAGRARWRIESETFNTMKNQGYKLGRNYGLGKKSLSAVFTTLMMLAFLIDQAQQLGCWLFQAALEKEGAKKYLWENIRGFFHNYDVDSMESILRAIAFRLERNNLNDVCTIWDEYDVQVSGNRALKKRVPRCVRWFEKNGKILSETFFTANSITYK